MYLGSTRNDAGAVVHNYQCDTCSIGFNVTGIGQVINRPCRLPGCTSYDAELDVDLALSKGDVALQRLDGKTVVMRSQPLDPNRKEFLQRTRNRKHPLIVIRRITVTTTTRDDHVEVNFVAATCKACGAAREFVLSAPLRGATEIDEWMKKLTPCTCGCREADVAMRLDKVAPEN